MKLFTRRNTLIILFVVFLFLRLFVDNSAILLSSDSLKFMETAKLFPSHTLYNDQLYLLHPPFYPYVIHFFSLFAEDHIAGILISLISAVVTFFILYKFFMMLTKEFNITFFILLFYTLSLSLIISSRVILRESFVIMLIFLTMYFYVKGVKFNDKKSVITASIVGCLLAITSDHVVFIFPVIVLSYIFFNSKKINIKKLVFPNARYIVLPLLLILLFYSSWTFIKFYQYSQEEYYPNGSSGTPLHIKNLGLMQVISPQFFEDYHDPARVSLFLSDPFKDVKRYAFNLGYMFNMEPFSIPRGLNFTSMKFLLSPHHVIYMFLIYLPLALITVYGLFCIFKDIINTRRVYNNVHLYIMGLFLVFVYPITQPYASSRYILTSYIFFYYFISYGLVKLYHKLKKVNMRFEIVPIVIILIFLLIPFWFNYNEHFVLFNKKIVSAHNTGDFIKNNLPANVVIMAQPGYVGKLIYLTGNKMMGLYHTPERLLTVMDYYGVDYIIFGRYYTDYYHHALKSIELIKNNPDKFELIATVEEDYSDFFAEGDLARTDEVYIYKVKNSD